VTLCVLRASYPFNRLLIREEMTRSNIAARSRADRSSSLLSSSRTLEE
jgi:hypothetical protein